MTTTPQADNSINTLDLGVRLGKLEAGQEALQVGQEDLKTAVGKVSEDVKTLLRFMWGASAVVALAALAIALALTYWPGR